MLIGAIAGIAGSLINRGASYLEKKQEMDAEERRHAYDLEKMKLDTEARKEIARTEASAKTLAASYEHDTAIGQASQWVINLLRLVRPGITGYALFLVTVFWFTLDGQAPERGIIVTALLETLSMSVAWWFGDRSRR